MKNTYFNIKTEEENPKITQEDVLEIADNLKEAEKSDQPFLAVTEDAQEKQELYVSGDLSKIEKIEDDYTLVFRFPKNNIEDILGGKPTGDEVEEKETFYYIKKLHKGITLKPKDDHIVVASIMEVLPFFKEINRDEDGEVDLKNYSKEQLYEMYYQDGGKMEAAMYNLVRAFLGVDEEWLDYIMPSSVLEVIAKIMKNHPSVFNEANFI